MQRMIRQFAAEYTSKTSSTQDSSSPNSTKNQSLLKASLVASSPVGATAQNPVLSKLLMADQDSPLDLTVRKSQLDPSEQDGVLDLSTKKSPCAGSASLSHSAGCSATPGNGEGTTEAIDCPGQPKSPLEKFMVRLCTYHQKRFVHVLNDICTEVQPGCEGQQLPGPGNMDISTCSSGCSQYRTENQDLGTTSSELKHLPSLDPEQSGPHGSLRILCHALKQAVDLKSSDRRENCSPIVRRDFPELPNIRINSASPRDSPTQGYLTTSNSHYFAKGLEGQTPGHEQEMGIRKGEEDKDKMQSRALLGGYIAVKASHVNTSEDSLESRLGSQKNAFKPFPEETREPVFSASSPWKADKENALQCSSKASLHPDTEINDQESRPKVDNHLQSVAKSKGSGHVHAVEKTHLENTKDNWLPASPVPGVHHKTTNGHSRAKSISVSSKSTRKSKRSSGLRINDYDNQCDVVFISQPITECHFESKRAVSSRKTARKSTRGYYYNGDCCELPTVRTLAKASCVQANGSAPAPRSEVLTSPGQAEAHVVSEDGDKRSSLVSVPPTDSSDKETQDTAEPCPDENNPPEASPLKQREARPAETPTEALSPLPCPVLNAGDSSLSASSFHSAVVSSPQMSEQELQEQLDISDVLQASSTMDSCKSSSSHEDSGSMADFVPLSISETADGKQNSFTLENTPEPPSLVNQEHFVSVNQPLNEEPTAGVDLLPPSEGSTATVDLPPSVESPSNVELPRLLHVDLAEPQTESPALDSLDASVVVQAELPMHKESVCSGEFAASLRAASPVALPASVVPETLAHRDLASPEPPAVESVETIPGRVELELPQFLSSSDAAELPASLQCAGANESINTEPSVEGTQNREEGQAAKSETMLPIVDTGANWGGETVEDTGTTSKMNESKEGDGKAPPASGSSETSDKQAAACKISTDKKRKREKKTQVASDRWLRSQQPLSPTEDSSKQPGLPASLQLPQLQIKLSKSPGAKRFKREVHLDGAGFVSIPSDCSHETLLTDTDNTHGGEYKQQPGEEDDITKEETSKNPLPMETAIEEGQHGDDKSKLGTMLKVSLEANYDTRSVHVPVGISDEGEEQTDRNQEAVENSDSAVEVRKMSHPDHEIDCHPCPDSKNGNENAPLETSVRYKKPALQFYNLRRTPALLPVATVQKSTPGKEITESDSNVTEQQRTGDEEPIGFSNMEVLSNNKPRFVEWCDEEENQELITNFNAQYMKVQKGWIQLEKEAPPAPKVKNKSDKLKEIWKSKKRTRKFKGSTEVQKLSPVQMLFMKAFDMSDICRWFMETTETKSLVIVKKLNTRLPGDIPLIKLPLQKGSSPGIYPSSLQAERLKKHLKKFAAMTPAKTTIKTQRLWARLQEGAEETEPEQVASTKQTSPSEVTVEHAVEARTQPRPATPVQTSSRVLRKCSNLRCKLPGQQKVVKQEKNDCVTKQPSTDSKPSRKSLCIKPLVSPKLAQQVKAAPLPTKSIPVERGGKERKGKGKLQEDTPSKGDLQPRKKKPLCETSRAQGQLNTSSKNSLSLKKASKLKHLEVRATQKHTAVERSNKRASRDEKVKKPQPGKKKLAVLKGKANANPKATLPSKQVGFAKHLKQKVVQDSSGRSLKVAANKASCGKALTRSMKIFQQNNKAQSKRKLGANKNSSPCKRRRLDAK